MIARILPNPHQLESEAKNILIAIALQKNSVLLPLIIHMTWTAYRTRSAI